MTSLQYLQQTKKGQEKRLAPHEISTFNTRQTWLRKHSDHHILYIARKSYKTNLHNIVLIKYFLEKEITFIYVGKRL